MITLQQRFALLMLTGFCQYLLSVGRLTELERNALRVFTDDARKAFGINLNRKREDNKRSDDAKIIYGVFDAQ